MTTRSKKLLIEYENSGGVFVDLAHTGDGICSLAFIFVLGRDTESIHPKVDRRNIFAIALEKGLELLNLTSRKPVYKLTVVKRGCSDRGSKHEISQYIEISDSMEPFVNLTRPIRHYI